MIKRIEAKDARQGRSGWRVLVILVAALALAMLVWWGVGIYGNAISPDHPVGGDPAEQPEPALQPPN